MAMNFLNTTTVRTLMAYHDGQVSCRLVQTPKGVFWMTGQIVRDAYTRRYGRMGQPIRPFLCLFATGELRTRSGAIENKRSSGHGSDLRD